VCVCARVRAPERACAWPCGNHRQLVGYQISQLLLIFLHWLGLFLDIFQNYWLAHMISARKIPSWNVIQSHSQSLLQIFLCVLEKKNWSYDLLLSQGLCFFYISKRELWWWLEKRLHFHLYDYITLLDFITFNCVRIFSLYLLKKIFLIRFCLIHLPKMFYFHYIFMIVRFSGAVYRHKPPGNFTSC
jgi:hypothetical protein